MNFLAPLFLLGTLAVALPVVFHLMRRSSREKIPFSSLMFLTPTPPRMTRRSRLEHILLLILRCVVLGLLAAGFARPYWHRAIAIAQAQPAGKQTVVLIDVSASMLRSALWTEAKAKALAAVNAAGPLDQVAVCTFDRSLHSLIGFNQWQAMAPAERGALVQQRLGEVAPGWSNTHLGKALIQAVEILEGGLERGTPAGTTRARQILVISDLQEGSRLEGLQGYEWPRGIEVVFEPLRTQRPTNAGLQWLADEPEGGLLLADAGPRFRINNATESKREQFQIHWRRGLTPAATQEDTMDLYVPAGQSRIAAAPKTLTGWTEGRLQLTGDDEDFDNTIYLIEPPIETVKVLFLGADAEKDATQLLYFLKRAFQETRRQTVQILARPPAATLLADEVNQAALVIIADTIPAAQFETVRSYMASGHMVLLVMKSVAAAASLDALAGSHIPDVQEAAASGYAMLSQIDFAHPLFAPFADPRFSDFTKIHFWRHRRVAVDNLPQARVIARFENGDPAMIQFPAGPGSLLVFTAGWQPADSQLAVSSKFVPLLYSLLEQSRAAQPLGRQYWVGDEVNLDFAKAATSVKVLKPDGTSVELTPGNYRFTQADQPGIYTVDIKPNPQRFVVNLAPDESKTTPISLVDLERLGIPLRNPTLAAEHQRQVEQSRQKQQAAELESQQKLWQWLLFGALAVVVIETSLAGWLTRRQPLHTEVQT